MIKSIDEYLGLLKKELNTCDRAIIQDALSDAEEYLRDSMDNAHKAQPAISEDAAMQQIIDKYGMPEEVAAAYKENESRNPSAIFTSKHTGEQSFLARFFGVFTDPRTWGSLLYLLFSLATGIIYFTWVVTGLSLSFGLIILIIGLPFLGIFLLSVRGLALIEGRIVETLLGIRMPRRPLFSNKNVSLWGRFKALFTEKYSWLAIIYMVIQFPLGIFYFCLFVTLFSICLWLIGSPILALFGLPFIWADPLFSYYSPVWLLPLLVIAGIILMTVSMHLTRIFGDLHGKLAKSMLVKD
ncbi:MAG: sensor domain-containing protein [Chloroflexi bacterium]|nr:sensor domain-containing protein [Chloroflexota bacterium]